MGNIDIEVEDLTGLQNALRRGVKEGARESAHWHTDEGKNKAQDLLRAGDGEGHPRIWRREVYHGFHDFVQSRGTGYVAQLTNTAPHAHIVEHGRRPGATPPPVQKLMSWVVDKLDPSVDVNPDLVDSWDPELQALAATYGPGYVRTAFNVQDKIREEGIEGIRFMSKTESYLKQVGGMVTHRKVEKNIEKQLKLRGL